MSQEERLAEAGLRIAQLERQNRDLHQLINEMRAEQKRVHDGLSELNEQIVNHFQPASSMEIPF